MKEITILSGKGGTGKTSVTAGLATLAKQTVFCDNDVDAADLFLILKPVIKEEHVFEGSWIVEIDTELCTNCAICKNYCRFNAIHYKNPGGLEINPHQCEGCRLCERVCPSVAITSTRSTNNFWYVSDTRFGKMVHAEMGPGEENSGKLVTEIRKRSKEIAQETNAHFIINDGPPGIGCAAISSLSGTQIALIVIEPSKSGLHDAKRLVKLIRTFNIVMFAIINKYDINLEMSKEIKNFLTSESIQLLAELPFDIKMVEAMIESKSIVEYAPGSETSQLLKNVWENLKTIQN